jgi:hypothetical protein
MEKQLFKLVNLGLEGEPVVHGLQNPETLQVIQYENIKYVSVGGEVRDANIPNDPDSFINNENHLGYASVDENDIATLYFD